MIYFGTAKNAGDDFKTAYEDESNMSGVTINGKKYDSIEDYMEEINPTIVEGNIEDWGYDVESDGTVTIQGYLKEDTTIEKVIIPNRINGIPVKKIESKRDGQHMGPNSLWNNAICNGSYYLEPTSAYVYKNESIKEVIISNGIEVIGGLTFAATVNLSKVSIPQGVKEIQGNAFYSCNGLTEITIPSSVTTMGFGVFNGIPSITVHVPWKEGEKPDGWIDGWNSTSSNCKIEVVYAE